MKIFNSLPEVIHRRGKTYALDAIASAKAQFSPQESNKYKARLKAEGLSYITISVLNKNLRGKRDLYGRPYRPILHIFIEQRHAQN